MSFRPSLNSPIYTDHLDADVAGVACIDTDHFDADLAGVARIYTDHLDADLAGVACIYTDHLDADLARVAGRDGEAALLGEWHVRLVMDGDAHTRRVRRAVDVLVLLDVKLQRQTWILHINV